MTRLPLPSLLLLLPLSLPALHAQTSAQTSSVDRQRAALKKACASGALSPDECQAKLAALNGSAGAPSSGVQASGQASGQPQMQTTGGFPSPGGMGDMQQWHDPRNRFNIAIPAGWQVKGDENQLQITQGPTWAVFTTSTNQGQPLDVVHAVAGQMQGQYQQFEVMNQGSFQTRMGHPAAGMTIHTVKAGKPAVVLLVTQGAGQGHYLTMVSYTPGNGGAVNGELNNICQTVQFGNETQMVH